MFGRQVTLKLRPDPELTRIVRSEIIPILRAYPQVLTALANVIEEVPTVRTFDFVTSTVHPTGAGKLA